MCVPVRLKYTFLGNKNGKKNFFKVSFMYQGSLYGHIFNVYIIN